MSSSYHAFANPWLLDDAHSQASYAEAWLEETMLLKDFVTTLGCYGEKRPLLLPFEFHLLLALLSIPFAGYVIFRSVNSLLCKFYAISC